MHEVIAHRNDVNYVRAIQNRLYQNCNNGSLPFQNRFELNLAARNVRVSIVHI